MDIVEMSLPGQNLLLDEDKHVVTESYIHWVVYTNNGTAMSLTIDKYSKSLGAFRGVSVHGEGKVVLFFEKNVLDLEQFVTKFG